MAKAFDLNTEYIYNTDFEKVYSFPFENRQFTQDIAIKTDTKWVHFCCISRKNIIFCCYYCYK